MQPTRRAVGVAEAWRPRVIMAVMDVFGDGADAVLRRC